MTMPDMDLLTAAHALAGDEVPDLPLDCEDGMAALAAMMAPQAPEMLASGSFREMCLQMVRLLLGPMSDPNLWEEAMAELYEALGVVEAEHKASEATRGD